MQHLFMRFWFSSNLDLIIFLFLTLQFLKIFLKIFYLASLPVFCRSVTPNNLACHYWEPGVSIHLYLRKVYPSFQSSAIASTVLFLFASYMRDFFLLQNSMSPLWPSLILLLVMNALGGSLFYHVRFLMSGAGLISWSN